MSNDHTVEDYYETVEAIAKEIIEEYGLNENLWYDLIIENVDGNSYIIYYAGNDVVKQASKNYGDDWREIHAMAGDDADDDRLKMVASYMAMEQDIWEACRELAKNAEYCPHCDTVFFDPLDVCENCQEVCCDDCKDEYGLCPDCQDNIPEPDFENDAFYSPSGRLGSKTSASFCQRHLGEFDSDDEALDAIRKQGKQENWFPNVWFIDDHGGHRLEEGFKWE
jgi:hypothetical protein